ncbi:MAG: 2-oxoglutarate and iron-dependent oxygenase domain-containing protein [Candidatus Paceibacterota bacterium]
MLTEIPVVDPNLARRSSRDMTEFVETVGKAFHDVGFLFVRAPDIAEKLPPVYSQMRKVFNLPVEIKGKYAHPEFGHQRGWTPPRTEIAIACRHAGPRGSELPDEKENWFVGPQFEKDHPLVRNFPLSYPPIGNVWPTAEAPDFRPAMWNLYNMLMIYGRDILDAVGQHLGKPDNFFREIISNAPSPMRAIHYPPVSMDQIGKIAWACKHTDINLITVLPASTKPGLWIRRRDKVWIPGTAPEGCVIVQVGDVLQYLTGGELLSAWHEVRPPKSPTTEGRFSAALFIHARPDVMLEPDVEGYPPMLDYDFFTKRMVDIGLFDPKMLQN